MKKVSLILLLLVVAVPSLMAFDGERSGFFAGAGFGYGPSSRIEVKGFSPLGKTTSGMAVSFMAGYGVTDDILIAFYRDGIIHGSSFTGEDETVYTGFTGFTLMYYFDDPGESVYMLTGLGLQDYTKLGDADITHDVDIGFILGGGYEFREHVQAGINFSYGKTKTTFEWNHYQLTLLLSFVAY